MILLDEVESETYNFGYGGYQNGFRYFKEFEKKYDISFWDGEKDSLWYEPLNWKNNQIPSDTAIVHINEGRPFFPVIDTFVKCQDLLVGSRSSLTINSSGSLTVDSSFINYGNMYLFGDEESKASFICKGNQEQLGNQQYTFQADSIINDLVSSPIFRSRRADDAHMQIMEFNTNDNAWEEMTFYPLFTYLTEPYWYRSSDSSLSFVGELDLFDIRILTSITENGIFHFSNPYPSSLDLNKLDLSRIQNQALYRYDLETNTYVSYIDGIGEASMLVEPLESFCIYSDNFESIDLTSEQRIHKIHYSEDTVGRKDVLCLELLSDGGTDKTFISFNKNATANFDGKYDALKLTNKDALIPSIFTKASEEKLQINQLPDTAMMDLFVESGEAGNYTISVGKHQGFGFLVLEDLIWKKRIDLLKQDYTFEYFVSDGQYPFKLYFSQWALEPVVEDDIQIYYYPESIVIRSKKQIEQADIIFYDLAGRKALEFEARDFHYFEKPIQLPAGHYIVQLRSGNLVTNKKVLIRK